MKKKKKILNNKGFTLVEVLAVVALLAIIGLIAVPNVLSAIQTSKQSSYDIMIEDILIAGQSLFEELDYAKGTLYQYDSTGKTENKITITEYDNEKIINTNLQTLVSNGFLTGINNDTSSSSNQNKLIILNQKNNKDIGLCDIIITKKNNSGKISYTINENTTSSNHGGDCPKDEDYSK